MAGIYIHIPYCKKACHYCNFHFSTTRYNASAMIDALVAEAQLQKEYFSTAPGAASKTIGTIYFGGGTPSILPPAWIERLTLEIKKHFPVDADPEITLEANPDDINRENLQGWRQAGVNRLSIGVQSFFDADLQWMNRAHSAKEAYSSIQLAQDAGITNLSIDLIYGTPYLSYQHWLENLAKVTELSVPHLSAYALTVEPRTALFKLIEKGKIPPVDTAVQSWQFDMLIVWAKENGFEHYEISNLAKPGHRSRHNSSYWLGVPYLGLGPAAHSFDGHLTRKWNIDNNSLYIQAIKEGKDASTKETLTTANQINEYIMIRLRMMEGLDLAEFERLFGQIQAADLLSKAKTAIKRCDLLHTDNKLRLTMQGKHFADRVSLDLFV